MSVIQQPGSSAPNPEDKFAPSENHGALLLFFPHAFYEKTKTEHGEADVVDAKIVRLNDGRVWENARVFSIGLVGQLKNAVPDGIVLGTLGQGENKKGNPPWVLLGHDAQQNAQAEAWIAANPRIQQAPQPSAGTPAWGAPATPAAPAWGGSPAPAAAPAPPAQGGWGAPAPAAPQGWGSPAPAAPAATGWGGAPADQVNPAAAGWGAPAAPPAPPAPAPAPQLDPNAVAAKLTAMGVAIPPGTTLESLMGLAAVYGITQ